MSELAKMIAHCENRGGLNLSDISRWLDTALPTVREWKNGRIPRDYKKTLAHNRLTALVKIVDKLPKDEPLIPPVIKQRLRAPFIEKLKNEHIKVSRKGTA